MIAQNHAMVKVKMISRIVVSEVEEVKTVMIGKVISHYDSKPGFYKILNTPLPTTNFRRMSH